MKLNSDVKIVGCRVVLVPYKQHHVPKYHEWMKSEELQKLTASQPLTLEQEYAMQQSWLEDADKCTFIVLDRSMYDESQNEVESMIGDTNIFITDEENKTGEIEIMIAEESARGKKMGWEVVILMLLYSIQQINLKSFEAKISFSNTISIKMFEKLGFMEKSRSEVFQEITLEKEVNDVWIKQLNKETNFEIRHY